MQTSYRLNAKDLDHHFLESLKLLFQDKKIEIIVYDFDETAYLSRSQANQRQLLKAIENAENGTNLITVNLEELEWVGGLALKHLPLRILTNGQP